MANSTQSVVSDGTLALLDLSINYLDRSEISVYFDAVLTTDWAWVGTTAKQITFSPVVPVGTSVLVKRTTNISKLRHEFSKGAAFSPGVLDEDLTQVLHIAQEASEANLSGQFYADIDMHNYRVKNVGTAVDDTDALTLGQYKADAGGAWNARDQAVTAKTAAEAAAAAASVSAGAASASQTASAGSKTAAAASAAAAAAAVTAAGDASRLTVGTVTTGAAGTNAAVSIAGAAGSQTVSFTIPRGNIGPSGPEGPPGVGSQGPAGADGADGAQGPAGPANVLTIGAVESGLTASASITGTAPEQVLNLVLPKGDKGDKGDTGDQGPEGPAGAGSGDVLGPGEAVTSGALVRWTSSTGTAIGAVTFSGLVKLTGGVPSAAVAGTDYLTSYTETDPVFMAHAAANVTNTKISQWGTAYSWGNHALAGYLTSYVETDPVFNASAAKNITGMNITNWNTAYGWGNHALAGYLTSFTETDPVFNASAAKNITAGNITNWNTAYSWGNHATAGYATTAQLDALKDIAGNAKSASYTLALTDRGLSIDTTASVVVPANTAVAFPVGSTVTVTNTSSSSITLSITTDTLRLAGTATAGTRTIAQYGVAVIRKISSTVWLCSGAGVT